MADYQGKGVLCIAESRHGKLAPTIFELLTAAKKIADARGEAVEAAVIGGKGIAAEAAAVAERGASKVHVLEHEGLGNFLDEAYAAALAGLIGQVQPRTVLFPATVYSRSLAPRVAVALKAGLASDAIDLELDGEKRLVVKRSCYAGNVIAGVTVKRQPELATVRPMAFEKSRAGQKGEVVSVPVDPSSWGLKSEFVKFSPDESGEIDVQAAEKIVSGGRGLGGAQTFDILRQLAKELGAAIGASRAAVDSDWIPYKHQVGLTGKSVRPRLYIACGISGQIQHLAGMNASDTIVAINTDSDCPMMKMATYAVQGDLKKVVPALIEEIKKAKG